MPRYPDTSFSVQGIGGSVFTALAHKLASFDGEVFPFHVGDTWLEPPEGCDEPADADRTRVRYEFAVVPGPLLPKLLVRTFSLIEGERCWRRGAILRFGKARARVWTTQDERWVHITAVGGTKDRNELLTMVRVTLRELFTEYKDLHAVEQWEHDENWVPRRTLESIGELPADDREEEVER